MLAEYLAGGLDPRRLRVLAGRVVAVGMMLDGAGLLEIFESLRAEHRIPARTAWSIASRVVVGGGSSRTRSTCVGSPASSTSSRRAAPWMSSSSASSRWTTSR